ncbi:unnamed protein product [marine sediment metagenome]|uniref:Uncharacterized protein n=1 Tax=marine sediment metagenome TaxID=412755 RepID=X1FP75_9ZZZZ
MVLVSFKPYEIRLLANSVLNPNFIETYKFDIAVILEKFYKAFNKRQDKLIIKDITNKFFKKFTFSLPTTYKKKS